MLTREDFVAPKMSGETNLQRSSWKAEAIRRGDLKISGPIPITEDVPLNEEEENEYAERKRLELAPLPQNSAVDREQLQPPPAPVHAPPPVPEAQRDAGQPTDVELEKREEPQKPPPPNSPSPQRVPSETHRRTVTEPIAYSTPSPFSNRPDSSVKTTPKKKRKSGLRHVFRKMFGKKAKGEEADEEPHPVHRGHSHHSSDPGLLRKASDRDPSAQVPRISDIQVQEPKPLNPLGQHLPFPMNVNAPQETSPPHEYLTFEVPPPDLGRRRATLPGILGNAETQSLNGQKRRPELWEEQPDNESIPSPEIGLALSTPYAPHTGHISSLQSKRRSRSAGALRDLAKGRPSVERRRSAEIRYWRHSHTSTSMYGTNASRPRTAQTVDTDRTVEAEIKSSDPATVTLMSENLPVDQHVQDISEIQLPVEAFNFGNFKSDFSDDDDDDDEDLASEPVTTSHPNLGEEKRLSIEERVKHLEDDMRILETSVHRLSGRHNRQTIILENAPKGRRNSRNRSSSATSDRPGSRRSSRGSTSTLQHYHSDLQETRRRAPGSPLLGPLSAVDELPSATISADQNTSSSHSQSQHQRLSASQTDLAEQVLALTQALAHERNSRKALEEQVIALQSELANLHALVHKLINTSSPHYPTPSPDAVVASSEERMPTPRASLAKERERYPELIIGNSRTGTETATEFARSDRGGETWSDHMSEASSRDDMASPEAWATPKEESGANGGVFFGAGRPP